MRKRLLLFVVLLAIGVCAVSAGTAAARSRPGNVDTSFGSGGSVVQAAAPAAAAGFFGPFGEDMAIGLEDEIYALQSERHCNGSGPCGARLFLERYWRTGVLDQTFGVGGRSTAVTVSTSPTDFSLRPVASMAVTPAGEVIVATLDGGELTLLRFDRFGQLSPSFGSAGRVTTTLGGLEGRPRLAISSDGRILVAASSPRQGGASYVWLARFSSEGALDPSFGAGLAGAVTPGVLAIPAPSTAGLGLSPGGRIAMGGLGCCLDRRSSIYFGRRDPDGHPLRPFTGGKPWRNLAVREPTVVSAVFALPRGRIAMVASSEAGATIARLLPSGRRDRTFGKAGVVRLKHLQTDVAPALADSAGNVYVAGYRNGAEEFASNRAVIARVTRRGRLDRRFGAAPPGYSLLPQAMSDLLSMGFQSNGKLVAFGMHRFECIRACPLPNRVLMRLYTSRRQGR